MLLLLQAPSAWTAEPTTLALPAPQTYGGKPLKQTLKARHTSRTFRSDPLLPQTVSNLLWEAFGINRAATNGRTAPSAHDVQDISIYVVTADSVRIHDARDNALRLVVAKDIHALTERQSFVKDASINLVYIADFDQFPRDSEADKIFYAAADAGFIRAKRVSVLRIRMVGNDGPSLYR